MIRRLRALVPATVIALSISSAPVAEAKSNWTDPYEPPSTIDLLVVSVNSAGQPYPTACQVITEYPTYDFHKYVTEVLPNEWFPSWPAASLKAGAEAIKNYGWSSTMITGHTCASSHNADLTNSTDDQYWKSPSAMAATTEAIDRTFATRMYNPNAAGTAQIWRPQYVAGLSSDSCGTVSGRNPSDTLGQYGSLACASGGWSWEDVDTIKYYYGYSPRLENDQDLLLNPKLEHDACGVVTARWTPTTGVTAFTTCSSSNNIDGTHFARVDGTGSGNTSGYTAIYQNSPEAQTGTTFSFSAWVRCLSGTCTFTPRLVGIGGTSETYDGSALTVSDSFWRQISVSHALASGHTSVRGMVRGSGNVKFDMDLANLW